MRPSLEPDPQDPRPAAAGVPGAAGSIPTPSPAVSPATPAPSAAASEDELDWLENRQRSRANQYRLDLLLVGFSLLITLLIALAVRWLWKA